ncbi:FlgO family outer membrane protein [Pseudoalteromonas sp. CnMc7-15]|uniref:FlgO family outer membrane protein n=1 Tax=unclassified Pseudoalteromonas TaxID=194690 RepID=UPI001EF4BE53|nr:MULTISPECIES: FlgO family outer membrane protein [unclassified Pseudoalteromonas]MCG7567701.1 FlgO family outer membrane protein [Pseudoalteromonas sp. CnMc7-15]MCG7570928.1 FlgO family outer membrane protein [Pseudoalteromonas sp. CNC9-20]
MNTPAISGLLSLTLAVAGCASMNQWTAHEDEVKRQAIEEYESAHQQVKVIGAPEQSVAGNTAQYQGLNNPLKVHSSRQSYAKHSVKNINHYVRGLMQDMMSNIDASAQNQVMAVSSFVYLDTDYQQGTLLGNQLAESFMHELHEFGVPVVDYKTTDYIRVTPDGDFAYSRDFLELQQDHPMRLVLAGTLVKHQGGVLVNARIVSVNSKMVIASSQGLIPNDVVNALLSNASYNGVELSQAN